LFQSLSFYVKIIPFTIKNKKIIEFLKLEWQKDTDVFRIKRAEEYSKRSLRAKEVISKMFPGQNINQRVLEEINLHIDKFIEERKNKKPFTKDNPYPVNAGLPEEIRTFLFAICFLTKPNIVVETGIANGFSSSYILFALEKVKNGNLISIDNLFLPWHAPEKIGQVIPQSLKDRHEIILGDAPKELLKLFKKIDSIDIFIHDSAHTYHNMMKEYQIAWPHIKNGGFLLSDDVSENDAFLNFADHVKKEPIIIEKQGGHFGVLPK